MSRGRDPRGGRAVPEGANVASPLGIENLPDELEELDASYAHHARAIRDALSQKADSTVLSELILVLAKLEQQYG